MTKQQFMAQIARPAVRMRVGGFRPVDNPLASWLGKVLVGSPTESWPYSAGLPMIPLCQINLTDFAHKPALVADLALITLFIDVGKLPADGDDNGTTWCLRTYKTLEEVVSLNPISKASPIKPFQMVPEVIAQDFPAYEDCSIPIPTRFEETYSTLFPNVDGIKVGGWPTLIQSEIQWNTAHDQAMEPQFAFQIDSVAKAGWQWGDRGMAYFGRGTKAGKSDDWTLTWQCY